MRSIPLIRCLSKMSPSSSTSTGSHIATWRRSLTWTRHDFNHDLRSPSTGKDHRRFSVNPAQRDTLPHRQSQLADLTIRLHITTSSKSISQKRWLYHQILKMVHLTSSTLSINHDVITNRSSSSLVKSPSVTVGHKYVNVHRHQLLISSKINNGWSMAVTVLQRKASTQQIDLPISASN